MCTRVRSHAHVVDLLQHPLSSPLLSLSVSLLGRLALEAVRTAGVVMGVARGAQPVTSPSIWNVLEARHGALLRCSTPGCWRASWLGCVAVSAIRPARKIVCITTRTSPVSGPVRTTTHHGSLRTYFQRAALSAGCPGCEVVHTTAEAIPVPSPVRRPTGVKRNPTSLLLHKPVHRSVCVGHHGAHARDCGHAVRRVHLESLASLTSLTSKCRPVWFGRLALSAGGTRSEVMVPTTGTKPVSRAHDRCVGFGPFVTICVDFATPSLHSSDRRVNSSHLK